MRRSSLEHSLVMRARAADRTSARQSASSSRPSSVVNSTIRAALAVWIAAALGVGGAPAAARAAAPPCAGVRFLVDQALVPGGTQSFDAIVVDAAGDVTVASGCPASHARVGRRDGEATIRVRWPRCGALRGVRLNARLDAPTCTTLTATMTAHATERRHVTGAASVCGDGRLDPDAGEQCETGVPCAGGEACTSCTCDASAAAAAAAKRKNTTTTSTSTTSTSTNPSSTSTSTTTIKPSTTSTSTSTSTSSYTSMSKPTTSSTSSSSSSSSTAPSPTTTLAPPTTTLATTTTTTTTSAPTTTTLGGQLFEAANPWNTDVSTLPKSATSDGIIQALGAAGGWGFGSMRIDFSIEVLQADSTAPFRSFTPTADFYSPDCDNVPFPVPPGGAIEGEAGYQCVSDGDCHLIVVHQPTKTLYEMWRANISSTGTFTGGCAAKWDLTRSYPASLRGDQCSSADAGGFPMAAMLFSADEVASGSINHAIRFILPNSRMRAGVYVRPASHAGGPSGGANLPPYGVRFRLRADYPIASLPTEGARVIARAMQRYGMILSDGGNIALTAQSDRFTTHKWSEVGVDSHSLTAIQVSDMEVVGMGSTIPLTYDCVRNP